MKWGCVGVIALVIGLIWIGTTLTGDPCKDDTGAFVEAQHFIQDKLIAPGTASFPIMNPDGSEVSRISLPNGRCAFRVSSYVDAENGFGAKIRTKYDATVAPDDARGNNWTLQGYFLFN